MTLQKLPFQFEQVAKITHFSSDGKSAIACIGEKKFFVYPGDRYEIRQSRTNEPLLVHFIECRSTPALAGLKKGDELVFSHIIHEGGGKQSLGMWIPKNEFLRKAKLGEDILYIVNA